MAPQTSTKLTYEDYLLARRRSPSRDHRREAFREPSPNTSHQRIAKRIVRAFLPIEDAGVGEVFFAPYDVVLSMFDVVVPDLLFIAAARRHIITATHVDGAPDLVIEILSKSNRQYDRQVKFKIYERLGVPEYWIVDPDDHTVEVYRRAANGAFARALPGDTLTSPLLPGFHMNVRDLFV